jgi:gamma-glutamyl-gamma-aminobutyraldehyde dehydrogenase
MKRVWLEAGGKSANIVFADCPDLQKRSTPPPAASSTTRARCIAGTRLLLEESIADEFLARLKSEAQHWQPGNPLDPNTTMGMLIDNTHADSVHSFIRGGEAKARCSSTDGKIRGLPPSARPSLTSTRPRPSAGKRSSARCWW